VGTAGQIVRISYDTPNPTSTSRSEKQVSVKQNKFSTLEIRFDGVTATGGPVSVEKCSINGSANAVKLTGSVSANCSTDTLFALLTPAEIASIQAAFNGNKRVKLKVNANTLKGSVSIKCSGPASID
jgi:activator of HSP90 ATPase